MSMNTACRLPIQGTAMCTEHCYMGVKCLPRPIVLLFFNFRLPSSLVALLMMMMMIMLLSLRSAKI